MDVAAAESDKQNFKFGINNFSISFERFSNNNNGNNKNNNNNRKRSNHTMTRCMTKNTQPP